MIKVLSNKQFSNNFHKNRLNLNIRYDEQKARLANELRLRELIRLKLE